MDTIRCAPSRTVHRHFRICILIGLGVLAMSAGASTVFEDQVDTREGENLTLKCRFNQQRQSSNEFLYYWARSTGASFENVAIGSIQLNTNYIIDFRPNDGTYDLLIKNASYARDNGRFECRIKAVGTGADVHQEYYNITVLTLPDKPYIEEGLDAVATEGKRHELTCSSAGGSPTPTITWFREGSTVPLPAQVTVTSGGGGGAGQLAQTRSTLTLTPTREDDEAKFRCVVWNRAMDGGEVKRLETTLILSVNYHPRVEVGPANPMQVERDSTATLECNVDAKPRVSNVRWTHNGRFINAALQHNIHRVSIQDAGLYVCSADNGLGKIGEQEITLDVLTPPAVVIETKTREAEEGETIRIACSVTANPKPVTVEWLKEGNPSFRYAGEILELRSIRADHAGTYICRAVNIMMPYGENRVEREGNSTVTLLIRHRPGQATITPAQPVVHANSGVTLTCTANPPGWPVPQFRWFRDMDGVISTKPILAQGSQYVIPRVHFGSEGRYHCLAANELGNGEVASVTLVVHQAPQFLAKLQQHMTRQVGDADFMVTCSAKGKPKPTIHWLKDNREISADLSMYDVQTNPIEGVNGMMTVQSVLRFVGKGRPHGNELMSADRGQYSCLYQNEVDSANSSMQLRIEHAPIVQHRYNKVAYDLRETAEITCKVQAYPKPEFHWQFGKQPAALGTGNDGGHYEIETSVENNDMYTSVLRVRQIEIKDYGEYVCKVSNSLDTVRAHISLQPKGAPERPNNLQQAEVGPNYVQLKWDGGFDGGIRNTKYFVSYRKVAMPAPDGGATDGCGANMVSNTDWMEFDCQQNNPCVVKHLDQHQAYLFKVKALNTKGASKNSNDIVISTKVAHVPQPLQASFDPASRTLGLDVDATCLSLIAIAESAINENTPLVAWQIVETFPIVASGSRETHRETVIEHLMSGARRSSVRSMSSGADDFAPLDDEVGGNPRVRVKLCLHDNNELCGEYMEVEVGRNLATGSAMAAPTIIAIVVSSIVCLLLVTLLVLFGRCKRKQATKADDSSMRSAALTAQQQEQQNQEPPPYYPASALHNKSLDHSMDMALAKESGGGHKESLYGTQNDYVYYPQPTHQMADSEWLNTGYPATTNYAHSNNGGSVNSEDSVWQMKMGLAAQHGGNIIPTHHSALDLQQQQQQQQHQQHQHQQQSMHHQQQLQHQPTYGVGVTGLGYDMHGIGGVGGGGSHYGQTPVHDDSASYSYQPNLSINGGMLMSGGGGGGGMPDEYSYNTMRSTHSTSRGGQPQEYGADPYAGVPSVNGGSVGGGGGHMEQQIGVNSYFQV